ncbi:hypothetical protein [Nostoc sp.]
MLFRITVSGSGTFSPMPNALEQIPWEEIHIALKFYTGSEAD